MKNSGNLLLQAITKFVSGVALIGLLLFIPAGTLNYSNAWVFICALFIPMLVFGAVLFVKDKALLAKRLSSKESEGEQKFVIAVSTLMFIAGFAFAGFDFRYGWTYMPIWLTRTGVVLLLVGYGLFVETIRENAFISRTVEVQENQTVVSIGLYGIVRHPMYFASVMVFLSMPVVLGSWLSFAVFLIYPFLLVKRIKNEEEVLEKGLEGYTEYKAKVKYRMIPFIW